MTTSYKLYGCIWDGQPIPDICPIIKSAHNMLNANILKLSEQMNESNPSRTALKGNLMLDIDFIPETKAVAVWDFYLKRLLQIAEYYHAELVDCSGLYSVDETNNHLRDFYKRKAPKRSLAQSVGAFQMIC